MIVNSYSLSVFCLWDILLVLETCATQTECGAKAPNACEFLLQDSKQASWIWGHELEITYHDVSESYVKWATSLGLVYRIKAALFQPDIVVIGDNFAAHHILHNAYTTYGKSQGFLQLIRTLIGAGLGGIEGEDHKYQRRLLAPAFTAEAVEAMSDDIFFCVERMTQNLSSSLIDTSGTTVDIVPVISACTLDIIGRVGFGHDFEGGENKDAKAIRSAWHQDVVMSQTFIGFLAPRLLNIFPVAGHESTAVTADFLLLQLAQTPSVQRKLQQEIRTAASFDYKSIGEFEYLSAVVKEGLRLHPVGQPTQRIARHDDVIPLGTAIRTGSGEMVSSLAVEAGQVLQIPWAILNVNKQVWGDNADKFIPERWIEPGGVPPVDKLPRGPWNGVSSFSDGPQSCIGYRVAVLELKIILALLVRSFQFDLTKAKIVQSSMPLKVSLVLEL
ncbi:cytochrome P450 [Rhodocollybia butyracea]|uniref:Cytochrome P450 n=1 Tax=Rhodocollybia butyracea TaxID=206335 RepID=A0A9P5U5F5_9AGAR|nr:cytochrome P450 [Rhodocollybia butyracea]